MWKLPETEGRNDEVRLLEEPGILRFKNTAVSRIVRARILFDDIIQ